MKQTFLLRLFAIALFSLATQVIKSETSSCKVMCVYKIQKKDTPSASAATTTPGTPIHQDDGFFIKI
jgi:hypothetical protein